MGHTLRIANHVLLVSAVCVCAACAQGGLASPHQSGQADTLALLAAPLIAAGRAPLEIRARGAATVSGLAAPADEFASFLRSSRPVPVRARIFPADGAPDAHGDTLRMPARRNVSPAIAVNDLRLATAQNFLRTANVHPCQECGVRQRIVTGLLAGPLKMRPAVPTAVGPNAP